jgi:hypothetical protein
MKKKVVILLSIFVLAILLTGIVVEDNIADINKKTKYAAILPVKLPPKPKP